MAAIRTLARPSRTMQSAAAARIRLRASAAASSRWLGSLRLSAMVLPSGTSATGDLTVQSVSDSRLGDRGGQGPAYVVEVPLVESVHPRVLRGEHPVIEGARAHPPLDPLARLVVLPGDQLVELDHGSGVEVRVVERLRAEEVLGDEATAAWPGGEDRRRQGGGAVD